MADKEVQERAPDLLELQIIAGPAVGSKLPKPARFETSLKIGRTKASKLHIKDPAISEQHGVIDWTPDGWRLVDCGSSNGTWVNGERLEESGPGKLLKDGDIVRFGTETDVRIEIAPHADENITVQQYFEAECHRLMQRVKGRSEQHANTLAAEWHTQKQQLEELVA